MSSFQIIHCEGVNDGEGGAVAWDSIWTPAHVPFPSYWSLQQPQVYDAPAHHLRSEGLDKCRAHHGIVMAYGKQNGRSPYSDSPLLLNLAIISYERLTEEESHSEGQRVGFYWEGEATDNKREVLILYKKEGLIFLRKEKIQLQEGPKKIQWVKTEE